MHVHVHLFFNATAFSSIRRPPLSPHDKQKSDQFQADLYPETAGDKPALTAAQWFAGKNALPKLISLEKGFVATARKEFVTEASAATTEVARDPLKNPQTEKEVLCADMLCVYLCWLISLPP